MPLPIALDYRPALLSVTGIGRATRELARALAARDDVAVHLFGHSLARVRQPAVVPPNAQLHRAPLPGRTLPFLARLGFGADRLAGRVPVFHWTDYVHAPLSRARAVLTVHDLAFVRDPRWHGAGGAAVLRERTARAVATAAAIVVPSRATAADLRTFAPAAPPAVVIPFGADHAPASPLAERGDHVVCVGTIEPRKNHLALLAAWRLLPAPRPRLVVIGRPGWQCDTIVAALRERAAARELEWRTDADDAELWRLLTSARLVVFPSLWEGFGFPPLEAMRAGVPVVAHDNAPMRELGDNVFALADATAPEALAAAIDRALHDRAWREHASAAGRARAATFRWHDCAAAHAALYHRVAAS